VWHDSDELLFDWTRADSIDNDGQGEMCAGRPTANWLCALFDEVATAGSASACPEAELPRWFAHLILWMDASASGQRWHEFAARLANVLRISRTPMEWKQHEYAIRALIVREVMQHTTDAEARRA
jgi:hypothetical protein